jgi:FHS family L-fucose permease-like MFS transporter
MMQEPQASPGDPNAHQFVMTGYRWGFALVVSLFFLWAIANNFNDILIRQFQKALGVNRAEAGFIQFVFCHHPALALSGI